MSRRMMEAQKLINSVRVEADEVEMLLSKRDGFRQRYMKEFNINPYIADSEKIANTFTDYLKKATSKHMRREHGVKPLLTPKRIVTYGEWRARFVQREMKRQKEFATKRPKKPGKEEEETRPDVLYRGREYKNALYIKWDMTSLDEARKFAIFLSKVVGVPIVRRGVHVTVSDLEETAREITGKVSADIGELQHALEKKIEELKK